MNQSSKRKVSSGVYLIIDPAMNEALLLDKLARCIKEKIAAVQIWDNFKDEQAVSALIHKICEVCHAENIPVLINNRWELINKSVLDGVHFDEIPNNYTEIRKSISRPYLSGLTCNNDLALVSWASENKLDYISFCSIFPSDTANSCELVDFSTIHQASKSYSVPIFLAGGIKPENMNQLEGLRYTGVAVVSGIMSSDEPDVSIKKYIDKLNNNENRNNQ